MRGLTGNESRGRVRCDRIGAATASARRRGARLVVGDINDAGLAQTLERIRRARGTAHAAHYDLADAGTRLPL